MEEVEKWVTEQVLAHEDGKKWLGGKMIKAVFVIGNGKVVNFAVDT